MEIKEIAPQQALVIRATTTHAEIAQTLDGIFSEVFSYIRKNELTPAGPPFTRYLTMEEGSMEMEAGITVTTAVSGEGRIVPIELPGGKVADGWHIGPYDKLGASYEAMCDWITAQKATPAGAPWEVYWTNPVDSPDPATWKTQIIWPVC